MSWPRVDVRADGLESHLYATDTNQRLLTVREDDIDQSIAQRLALIWNATLHIGAESLGYKLSHAQPISDPCPNCGSKSLFIGSSGGLTCGNLSTCKNPCVTDFIEYVKRQLRTEQEALRSTMASHTRLTLDVAALWRLVDSLLAIVNAQREVPR
jgi:hypothetical protein